MMLSKSKTRPSVPGSLPSGRKEGAKNHRVYLGTFNCRTLNGEDRVSELEEELGSLKWDIIGLSETRREETAIVLKSGNTLYTSTCNRRRGNGTGFLVGKSIRQRIFSFEALSDRVSSLTIKINRRHNMKIIQAYLPTTDYDDEEVEEVYETILEAIGKTKAYYNVVMGDFNAKIGLSAEHTNNYKGIGRFGTPGHNDRGCRLLNFAETNGLFITNTLFQKKLTRRWTWISPDKKTKNEIDFILTDRPYTIKNLEVLNCVRMSDHRLVRATVHLNERWERRKLVKKTEVKVDMTIFKDKAKEYQISLANRFDALRTLDTETDTNQMDTYNNFKTTVLEAVASLNANEKNTKENGKLSAKTKGLMARRRDFKLNNLTASNKVEYAELCKLVRKEIRNDIRSHNTEIVRKYIENNKGYRQAMKALTMGKNIVTSILDSQGNTISDKDKILKECRSFYEELYKSTTKRNPDAAAQSENIQPVLVSEIRFALHTMKKEKASGHDGLVVDYLKAAEEEVVGRIASIFTDILRTQQIPEDWKTGTVILLHKKGDRKNLKNYRPITLLPHMYKLFTKVVCNRITKTLDENQSVEQAGFRKGFSTTDHLHTINQVIEKCNEYGKPLCIGFIDFEKAFDTVEHEAVFKALERQGVEPVYTTILKEIYKESKAVIRMEKESQPFKVNRGVRQGDTISPKLFTAVLEDVFRSLDWKEEGISINGERLSHLRFADDVVVVAETMGDLERMINDLAKESSHCGLRLNAEKTKVLKNANAVSHPVYVNGARVEEVNQYVNLGQLVRMNDSEDVHKHGKHLAERK